VTVTRAMRQKFYKTYTNSDFLKLFQVVRSEHSEVGDSNKYCTKLQSDKEVLTL
jgi:hypothetical protein